MQHPADPNDRIRALGHQLVHVHSRLRQDLARLRAGLAIDDDTNTDDADGAGDARERLRDLRAHCLGFCSALTRHHEGEDAGVFPPCWPGSTRSCAGW